MANVGSLEWAEAHLDEVRREYLRIDKKADAMQASLIEVGGRENLRELMNKLDEVIEVLERIQSEYPKAHDLCYQALTLYHALGSLPEW